MKGIYLAELMIGNLVFIVKASRVNESDGKARDLVLVAVLLISAVVAPVINQEYILGPGERNWIGKEKALNGLLLILDLMA